MTKTELIVSLQHISNTSQDTEQAHGSADDLLIAYINDEDIKRAYDAVPKWYA